jgi:hypothetical protein
LDFALHVPLYEVSHHFSRLLKMVEMSTRDYLGGWGRSCVPFDVDPGFTKLLCLWQGRTCSRRTARPACRRPRSSPRRRSRPGPPHPRRPTRQVRPPPMTVYQVPRSVLHSVMAQ